jgi:hypothetical protein
MSWTIWRTRSGIPLECLFRLSDEGKALRDALNAKATAALGRHIAQNPIVAPDLGGIRDEIRRLLHRMSDRARPDMIRLLFDMQRDLADDQSNLAAPSAYQGANRRT